MQVQINKSEAEIISDRLGLPDCIMDALEEMYPNLTFDECSDICTDFEKQLLTGKVEYNEGTEHESQRITGRTGKVSEPVLLVVKVG